MNILTFDLEDWFHILDNDSTRTEKEWAGFESRLAANTDGILELLEKKRRKATFFCLGWIAGRHPGIVRRIDRAGYEIASHSHLHRLVYEQDRGGFKDDLDRSVKTIEDITGKKVRAFRAPGFSIRQDTRWAFDVLMESGIEIDCSVFPAARAHGGFERFGEAGVCMVETGRGRIKQFPVNVCKALGGKIVFSGGGYFRLMPYWMIERMMRKSDYVMAYFHPRDFDEGQPVIKGLSRFRRFKSYYGLGQAMKKLERLLDDFEFTDLCTADKGIDWKGARVVRL